MERLSLRLIELMIIIICGVLTGAYIYQVAKHEIPCPLCLLQRLFLIGCCTGALFNIKFGIRMQHYGLTLVSAMLGATVSVRQILLHICPGSPSFGEPVLGLSLYTWAFIVFTCVILGIALLMFLYGVSSDCIIHSKKDWISKLSFILLFVISSANFLTTLMECGLGACKG